MLGRRLNWNLVTSTWSSRTIVWRLELGWIESRSLNLFRTIIIHWIWKAFSIQIRVQSHLHIVRGLVVDSTFFGKLPHSIDNFSVFGLLEINILGDHGVDDGFILISSEDELFSKKGFKLLSD